MRLRKWLLVVVALSFVISCRTDKAPPPPEPPAPPAAVMEFEGQTLVAIPVGGGNVLVIRAADAQFCPKGQGDGKCVERALSDATGHGCPTCEGCNCRLPACAKYCLAPFQDYLKTHYNPGTPTPPAPPAPPAPTPAPQ